MKNDRPPKKKHYPPTVSIDPEDLGPVELARLQEVLRKGLGNPFVIRNVLDDLEHPEHGDKRDLVGVILGLLEHLTPEQALALAEQLPARLPPDAVGKLSEAVKGQLAVNGARG